MEFAMSEWEEWNGECNEKELKVTSSCNRDEEPESKE